MLAALVPIALSFLVREISAQLTNATCDVSGSEWSFNSLGQSPCVMASYMFTPCWGTYTIYALRPGWLYTGPRSKGDSDPCVCSSVMYSLLSACQFCQSSASTSIEPWWMWTENCTATEVQNGFFIQGIPFGTKIPVWAFKPFDTNDTFSLVGAQQVAASNQTELEPASTSSSRTPISPSATNIRPTETPSPSSSSGAASSSNSSSTPVGAIVGGVVGGVAGIALIAGLVFFFLHKSKQKERPLSESSKVPWSPSSQSPTLAPTPQTAEHRLYDPNNPATFPQSGSYFPNQPYHPNKPQL